MIILKLMYTVLTKLLTFLLSFLVIGKLYAQSFTAYLSCEFNGQHMTVAACFMSDYGSSYIELTTGGRPDIIQPYQLQNLGVETSKGLKFPLSEKFSFRTVNVSRHLTLRLRIEDSNANNVFEHAVGRKGVIYVGN